MSEQVDIAVDLGAVPAPLPGVVTPANHARPQFEGVLGQQDGSLTAAVRCQVLEAMSYWTMLQRRSDPGRGVGKWKLNSRNARQLYDGLTDIMREGGLAEVCAIKVRTIPVRKVETVYAYCGPYNDLPKLFRIAAELLAQVRQPQTPLEQELQYKTDLQTIWQRETEGPKDDLGRPRLWQGRSWLYSYDGVRCVVNRRMLRLHEALEKGAPDAPQELELVRGPFPDYRLPPCATRADELIEAARGWLTVM
jgi:hypothetical protein